MEYDLRFVELEHELQLQADYIGMLENHLPEIVEGERRRIHALFEKDAPEDRAGLPFMEQDLDNGVYTRLFAAASVLGIWATYEASISEVAKELRQSRGLALKLTDLRGSFLDQARLYFRDALQFELHPSAEAWQELNHILIVRNAFAHANGRIEHLGNEKHRLLKLIASRYEGLRIVDDTYVIASPSFARRCHQVVSGHLVELFGRVRSGHL